jgi:shikimate dehydrogenase
MDQYAVVGNPISQSKSPLIHSLFAQQTEQVLSYTTLEAPLGGFEKTVTQFRVRGAKGLNITAPFKLEAYAYANDLTAQAKAAGAINCIKFDGATIYGDNFDGVGLVRDITHNLRTLITQKRVLLLGAGGAARGALLPLLAQKPSAVIICNRSTNHAVDVATLALPDQNTQVNICDYANLLAVGSFDLVIHATSAGLHGQTLELPKSIFKPSALAYDLTYGKGMTSFLKQAQAAGVAKLADGVGMLVEQAAEAFSWWRGVRPQTAQVIEKLRVPL